MRLPIFNPAVQTLALIICILLYSECSDAFSQERPDSPTHGISKRDSFKVSLGIVGGVAYAKLVGDTLYRISQGIQRPAAHEERVQNVITETLVASALSKQTNDEPFRILEVGIGTDCRLIRRGLYKNGLEELALRKISAVEITGVDRMQPSQSTIKKARDVLSQESRDASLNVELTTALGDIATGLPVESGYFDAVICCLTLCSVSNQEDAIREMKRLIRPSGGVFGYVEHVAVNKDEPYRFLEWQQELFDPLQQKLADNCHLHRYTDDEIDKTFLAKDESGVGVRLERERFLVDDMWPTTCQASGVIQMQA